MNLEVIDIVIRLIPEALIIILAGYAFSKKKFILKFYLISVFIQALATFVFRMLPISDVMPMVLSAATAVILLIIINRVAPIKAILSTLICFVLSLIYEVVNMIVLQMLFKIDVKQVFITASPLMRNIYGLPSFILFASTILIYYFLTKRGAKN